MKKKSKPTNALPPLLYEADIQKVNAILRKYNLKKIQKGNLLEVISNALNASEQKQLNKAAQISFEIAKGRFIDPKTGAWSDVCIDENSVAQIIAWLNTQIDYLLSRKLFRPSLFSGKKRFTQSPAALRWENTLSVLEELLARMKKTNTIPRKEMERIFGKELGRLPSPKKELSPDYHKRTVQGMTTTTLGSELIKTLIVLNPHQSLIPNERSDVRGRICRAASEILELVGCKICYRTLQKTLNKPK